jgi:cytochrome c2
MKSIGALFTILVVSLALGRLHPFGDPQRNLRQPREALLWGVPLPQDASAGDAERGRALFDRRCSGCHALDSEREGPPLRGVYGRRAGSVPGFQYSSSIRNAGITWNDVTLDKWLSDTDVMLPGNAMGISVPKLQDRADLIAFLKSLN